MAQSTEALKLGSGDGKRRVLQALLPEGQAFFAKWARKATPPEGTAALRERICQAVRSDFSKDGTNADFLL